MKIRLTKRFATFLDGIDLTRASAGELLDLSARDAALLILEGWATPAEADGVVAPERGVTVPQAAENASDEPRHSRRRARNAHRPRGGGASD